MRDRGIGFFPFLRAIRGRITGALAVLGALTADTVTVGGATGSASSGEVNATGYKINGTAISTGVPSFALYLHRANSGTGGGNSSAGAWTKVTTVTESVDADGIGSVASSVMTFAAGTYDFDFWHVFGSSGSGAPQGRVRLRDTTNNVTLGQGNNTCSVSTGEDSESWGSCRATFAGATNVELQYWHTAAVTNGLGHAMSTGDDEVFGGVAARKIA